MFARLTVAASLLLATPALAQAVESSADTAAATTTTNSTVATTIAYTRDTPVEKLAADPAAAAVVNKDLPGLLTDSSYPFFKGMSLHSLQEASGGDLSAEDVDKTVADLQALPPH